LTQKLLKQYNEIALAKPQQPNIRSQASKLTTFRQHQTVAESRDPLESWIVAAAAGEFAVATPAVEYWLVVCVKCRIIGKKLVEQYTGQK